MKEGIVYRKEEIHGIPEGRKARHNTRKSDAMSRAEKQGRKEGNDAV